MYQFIVASEIRRRFNIEPLPDKGCFVCIGEVQRIEMVYVCAKGAASGYVWFFICSMTGIRCRKLILVDGCYIHTSAMKNFYRETKPAWYSGTSLDKLLTKKQREVDALKILERKHFKSQYAGKPTKALIKCIKDIQAANGITMHGIINGDYNS